jgi:polar amino acid transport system substrate-binding protein
MPWGIEKADGNHQGMLVKFAQEFSDELQQPITNRLRPYPRVLLDINRGNADLAVLFKSPNSEEIGISLGQVVEVSIIAVGKKQHNAISSLDQLEGERIAYVRGSKYGPAFDNHTALDKVPVKNMNQGLRMLMRDHVDVVISTDQSIFYGIDTLGIDPEKLKRVYLLATAKADLYLSKKSTHQHRVKEFRAVVKRLHEKGVLNRIFYDQDYISSKHLNKESRFSPYDLQPLSLEKKLYLSALGN